MRFGIASTELGLKIGTAKLGQRHATKTVALHAGHQWRPRGSTPIVRLVETCLILVAVNDEQQLIDPAGFEAGTIHGSGACCRIADQYASIPQTFDHDEMMVALVVDENDRRQAGFGQLVQRLRKAIGSKTVTCQVALDVEQGKSFTPDSCLVALLVHCLKHHFLGDGNAILVRQQGGHRRGAAAEIVLLAQGGVETAVLHAGHGDRVAATDAGKMQAGGMGQAAGQHAGEEEGKTAHDLAELHVDDR